MTLSTLHISPVQQGRGFFTADSPVAASTGDTLICHNLRSRAEGILEYAAPPAVIATMSGIPLIADRRGDGYYMLRQEDDGSVMVDGFLDLCNNSYQRLNINLGATGRQIVQAEAAGRFVVLRFDDDTLGYIIFSNTTRSYTLLGSMPQFPSVTATPAEQQQLTETVEAVTFRTPQTDIRSGIDADATKAIGKALTDAWTRLRRRAAESGLWLQPVEVRVAYRLADGSLLHLSGPQKVAMPWQCGGRVAMLPVTDASGAATGAAASSMTATGYRLTLDPDTIDTGVWSDIISSIEVWVTEESDPVDYGSQPVVSTAAIEHVVRLVSQLDMRPEASLDAALAASPCGVLASRLPGASAGVLSPRADTLYNLDAEVMAAAEMPHSEVKRILGHDGFLHIATADALMTCSRGNPFRSSGSTPGDWSETVAMKAQIWGGGAYTRQIVYVAGPYGVTALAHDASGRHTNCRTICAGFPRSASFMAAADTSVYMLLDDGSLTRFSGTRAEKIITGIDGCRAICHSRRFGELLLLPESMSGHCVAIGKGGLRDVSTRERIEAFPVPGADRLLMRPHDNGLVDILSLSREMIYSDTEVPPCRWLGRIAMPPGDGMWRIFSCGISGPESDARLSVGQASPIPFSDPQPFTLTEMHLRGEPQGLLRFTIRPGATQRGPLATRGHWHAEISGRLQTIWHLSLQHPNQYPKAC